MMRRIALVVLSVFVSATAIAEGSAVISELDPAFSEASVLVMDSGQDFFSCAGHLAIRMRSPVMRVDKCFSYESEPVGLLLVKFLFDELKMGMFGIPTELFLRPYEFESRGVRQYRLNLPPDVKRALWILLDEKVAEGVNLKYDYIERGCAQSMVRCLMTAAARCGKELCLPVDRPYYAYTYRESFSRRIRDFTWYLCSLHLIGGIDVDRELPPSESAVIPDDVIDLLMATTLDGEPIVDGKAQWLVNRGQQPVTTRITPNLCAACYLVATILAVVFLRRMRLWRVVLEVLQAVMLVMQLFIGAFLLYMVFFSNVPGSSWNWLLIPLNPLPVLLWKWRQKWRGPYCAMLVIWIIAMLTYGHTLTYPAYIILAVVFATLTWAADRNEIASLKLPTCN